MRKILPILAVFAFAIVAIRVHDSRNAGRLSLSAEEKGSLRDAPGDLSDVQNPIDKSKLPPAGPPEGTARIDENLPRFDCENQPGLEFCRHLKELKGILDGNCNGLACIGDWETAAQKFSELSNLYDAKFPAKFSIDSKMGDRVNAFVVDACALTYTSGDNGGASLDKLLDGENVAMHHLKRIQMAAGRAVKDVAFCQRTMSNGYIASAPSTPPVPAPTQPAPSQPAP